MRCDTVRPRLLHFLLGELSEREANRIATHLEQCGSCFAELDSLSLTVDLIEQLPAGELSLDFDRRLAEGVERLRTQRATARQRSPVPSGLAWGTAGIVGLAVLLAIWWFTFTWSADGPMSDLLPADTARVGDKPARTGAAEVATPVSRSARVVRVDGQPLIRPEGTEAWATCDETSELPAGTHVKTGSTDRLEVQFADGSRASIQFDTSAVLLSERLAAGRDRPTLRIDSGEAWVLTARAEGNLVVRTPHARAEASGAVYRITISDSAPQPRTTVAGLRGSVRLVNTHGATTVGESQQASATGTQAPLPAAPLTAIASARVQVPWTPESPPMWFSEPDSYASVIARLAGARATLGVESAKDGTATGTPGLTVTRVVEGSPAELAGIERGDRLVCLGGITLACAADLARSELDLAPDQNVEVIVERHGVRQPVRQLALAAKPLARGDDDPALTEANRSLFVGEMTAVKAAYGEVRGPGRAAALNNLGLLAELNGEPARAVRLFEEACALSPGRALFHRNLGQAYARLGNLRRAETALVRARNLDPTDGDAVQALARVSAVRGKYRAAVRLARTLLHGTARSQAEGYALLAGIHRLQGRLTAAKQAYRTAIATDDSLTEPYAALASIALAEGRLTDARHWADRALMYDSTSFAARRTLGAVLARRERLDLAELSLHDAIALHPAAVALHMQLGEVQLRRGDSRRAEETYRRAVALAPGSSPVHAGLAEVLKAADNLNAARRELLKAVRLDPTNEAARSQLSAVSRQLGMTEEVREVLTAAERCGA